MTAPTAEAPHTDLELGRRYAAAAGIEPANSYTVTQVATVLGIRDPAAVRRLIRDGRLPKLDGFTPWRVPAAGLGAYLRGVYATGDDQ